MGEAAGSGRSGSASVDGADCAASRAFDHAVRFYEGDEALLGQVADFVVAALANGKTALVLATEAHRAGLAERLRARGVDAAAAAGEGRYRARDAAETLAAISPEGEPDPEVFAAVVGGIVDRAAAAVGDPARVAVFGELVALLCAQGRHAAAIRLERLWDDLARRRGFSVLCAYPLSGFARAEDGAALEAVCAEHSRVIPAERYASLAGEDDRAREIVRLQQQARALEREIAERERAEATLRRREAESADFVEQAPIAMHRVAADGTIVWANQAELDLVGCAREEYVGRHVAEFHADPEAVADILERLGRGETLRDHPARLRRKDGAIRHVQISSNVRWDGDEFVSTRCFTRDVTDRGRADEANERLAAIVDSSDDAIVGKTLDGTITSWNRAAERLFGYAAEEMVGRSITTIVPPERRAELARILERLRRGERIAHHETERVRKDGSRVEVSLSISPIRDGAGRIVGASKIARDITERRLQERRRQEFLSMVAHDLRSPLTAVKGYAQFLQRRGAYDERAVAAIVAQAEQMARLVADVLESTRLEAGRLHLRRGPVDLAALVRECTAHAVALEPGASIRVEAPDEPVVGAWDGDRLVQVLANLLDNALRHAPGGVVVVRVEADGSEARLSVIDDGPGIAAEDLPRVFERFFRVGGPSAPATGVGLGLFISRALVEAHGGRMWADSAVGQGSVFTLALPLAPPAPGIGHPNGRTEPDLVETV